MESNIENRKNELYLIQSSAQSSSYSTELYYFKTKWKDCLITNPIPLQFFTVTYKDVISLWEYEKESEEYKSNQMIADEESGYYRRGGINEEGIYVVAGHDSNNVKIYDMKYYNYPDHKIKLLQSFSHSGNVFECLFKNSVSAICCDIGGYIKEYDLRNPHSIPTPTIFNKTALGELVSIMETKDKKYIIAGGKYKLYILDAEDGTLTYTLENSANEGSYSYQIAEVRPNILVTADAETASLHDIRDIDNIPISIKLPDIGWYFSVTALESNPGDFAIGGGADSTGLGFVYIYHLDEDNQTITTLKYIDNIQESDCDIEVIKELKRGTIIIGGDGDCLKMCLWNYEAIPSQDPICWDDGQTGSINDILGVPY